MSTSNDDHERYGVHTTQTGWKAGVTQWDSQGVIDAKLAEHYKKEAEERWGGNKTAGNGSNRKNDYVNHGGEIVLFFWVVKLFAAAFLIGSVYTLLTDVSIRNGVINSYEDWKYSRARAERVKQFSDFSEVSKWPDYIQILNSKTTQKSLEKIIASLPEDLVNSYSYEKKIESGSRAWFAIAENKINADKYVYYEIEKLRARSVKMPYIKMYYIVNFFLKDQCKKNVEAACLDAAKIRAGLTLNYSIGSVRFSELDTINDALKELPEDGPLTKSEEIKNLRHKLNQMKSDV